MFLVNPLERLLKIFRALRSVLRTPTVFSMALQWTLTAACLFAVALLVQKSRTARPWSAVDFMDGLWDVETLQGGVITPMTLNVSDGIGLMDGGEDCNFAITNPEATPEEGALNAFGRDIAFSFVKRPETFLRVSSGADHHWTMQEPAAFLLIVPGRGTLVGRRRTDRNRATLQDKMKYLAALVVVITMVRAVQVRYFRQDKKEWGLQRPPVRTGPSLVPRRT